MHPAASVQRGLCCRCIGSMACALANEPGILHVRHPSWRGFEIALVLQALSSPKGQLRVTGLVNGSRYVSLGKRDEVRKKGDPW